MSEQGRIIFRSPNHPDLQPREEQSPAAVYVPPLEDPDALELAKNITVAGARWALAGFPLVDQAGYDARTAACAACPYWDGSARLGLGRCKAPGCGCTKFKRWLKTEQCKHPEGSRWPG